MTDRIKLAEAMGWERCDKWWGTSPAWRLKVAFGYSIARTADDLPDPYTDANDDYAVLEWMRTFQGTGKQTWFDFIEIMDDHWFEYKIGDYARAALKVIS